VLLNGHDLEVATVRDLIRERGRLGDRTLLAIEGQELTYGEADRRANRVANSLIGLGVGKGDIVATDAYSSVEHVCAWFGTAKASCS
jgi:crotonobetaine/carnitine-CoA ligase